MNDLKKNRVLIFLGSWLLVLGVFLSGCIRLSGKAGYWHKGPDDEYAKSKQVGFDTQKLAPGYTPGSVQMGES